MVGSSTTPNTMPSFLTSTIPHICSTLLALDISANFLGALPPCLALCASLEELNVASNPLRVLPAFLADLTSLRVLIADSTGISTLPDTLSELSKLHTLSVRRNKMHALPSWLCLLSSLETLYVDGNPFQGPWKALVDPLLAKAPMTPVYPPSTPMFPLLSAGSSVATEAEETDVDDLSDPPSSGSNGKLQLPHDDEDHTITPARPALSSVTAPLSGSFNNPPLPRLTRTRTTPNRPFYDKIRAKSGTSVIEPNGTTFVSQLPKSRDEPAQPGGRELRKMKSAGELRRGLAPKSVPLPSESAGSSPLRPRYPMSASSSNLLALDSTPAERPNPKRFASLGVAAGLGGPSHDASPRIALTQSLWDGRLETSDDARNSPSGNAAPAVTPPPAVSPSAGDKISRDQSNNSGQNATRTRSVRENKDKDKTSRWGFLKKMSMGKIKIDSPSRTSTAQGRMPQISRPQTVSANPALMRLSTSPQIDVRFSTTGTLGALSTNTVTSSTPNPVMSFSPPEIEREPPKDPIQITPAIPSPSFLSSSLLVPPSPLPRPSRRRSFLPIDAPLLLNTSLTNPATFVPGVTASNETDDWDETKKVTVGPVADTSDHYLRKEEERNREAYMRALRSVMAYLKDMNDLGLSQSNSMSMYGGTADDPAVVPRSRRPTDAGRELSMAISASASMSTLDASAQLRSSESMAGLRSGTSSQTLSVATDSSASSEERKFKDDKGKRAMVVREIVEYVAFCSSLSSHF